MKNTIDGNIYDSEKCEELAEKNHYSEGGNNYAGSTRLLRAADGEYLLHTNSNGQDLYVRDSLRICCYPVEWLDNVDLNDEQEQRLVELGLLKIVEAV